jgi:hypothetical protein
MKQHTQSREQTTRVPEGDILSKKELIACLKKLS